MRGLFHQPWGVAPPVEHWNTGAECLTLRHVSKATDNDDASAPPPSRDERPLMNDGPRLTAEFILLPAWSERGCLCPLVLGQRWGLFIRPAGRQQSQSASPSFLLNLEHPWTGHPQQTTEHASCFHYMLYRVLYSLNFALNSFSWSFWHSGFIWSLL